MRSCIAALGWRLVFYLFWPFWAGWDLVQRRTLDAWCWGTALFVGTMLLAGTAFCLTTPYRPMSLAIFLIYLFFGHGFRTDVERVSGYRLPFGRTR